METSDSNNPSDRSGTNSRYSGITRRLGKPIENPLYFLFLIFLAYWIVDLVATFILWGEIANWFIPVYHFFSGYVLIALYFKIVLPDFFPRKRKFLTVFSLLVLLTALVFMKLLVFNLFLGGLTLSISFLVNELLRISHFLALTSAIWILYDNLILRQKNHTVEMEHERLQIEHRSMQLSSHFILNVLSLCMARIIKLSPQLAMEFPHLTSLLRYSFLEFDFPNTLKAEIDAVYHYLEIQKMRFPNLVLQEHIHLPSIAEKLSMPKLCLLSLVENVFFQEDYTDANTPCKIDFQLTESAPGPGWAFILGIENKIGDRVVKVRSGFGALSVFRVLSYRFKDNFHYWVNSDGLTYTLKTRIDYEKEIQSWTN